MRRPGRTRRHQCSRVSAPLAFHGWDGLDPSNYYTATGIVGTQTGFHVQAWIQVESQSVSSANRVILANVPASPGNGWRFLTTTTNAALNFGCFDSTGNQNRASAALTLIASHLNRPLHICGAIRSGNVVLWVDGVLIGSGTPITSYAAPVSPTMSVGRRMLDTLSCQGDIRVLGGIAGGHYAPSDAEVLAAYQAGLSGCTISHIAGGTAQQAWLITSAGASIPPTVGAESLTRVGSPSYF